MSVVYGLCALLLTVAAVMAAIRVERGPTTLDRTIAFDTITAIMIGAVAVHAAASGRTDTVPVILALSLVGFVGSVTISRFAAIEPEGEGRVLSREELAELEHQRLAAEETSQYTDDHNPRIGPNSEGDPADPGGVQSSSEGEGEGS